jgi:serine protease Do
MPDFTSLVEKVGPAVVNVTTSRTVGMATPMQSPGVPGDPLSEFFRRFMPPDARGAPQLRSRGVGSGFVIDAEGYILTNAHVVEAADEVTVRLADSKGEHKARVVGVDPQTDVALLKVDAKGLPVAPISTSKGVRSGEWVAAIGSPFGFANTITAGIVSATERSLPEETLVPFIQTDVAVNPGNSGGPLLNMSGEVVGINSAIYSGTGGYMGVSFAIPIDVAMDIARQLRTEGRVTRGRIGVAIQEVSPELAKSFRMPEARGALVTQVEKGGPAQRAGVVVGDVITRFGGQDVASAEDLPRVVARAKPGTEVEVQLWRSGESRTVKLAVGQMQTEASARPEQGPGKGSPRASAGRLGLLVSELPQAGRRALGVDYGLVVEGVQEPNADAPLQQGDVIVAVNNQGFRSLDEFNRRVAEVPAGGNVALLVRRGEETLFVPMTVAKG